MQESDWRESGIQDGLLVFLVLGNIIELRLCVCLILSMKWNFKDVQMRKNNSPKILQSGINHGLYLDHSPCGSPVSLPHAFY